ncbi:hypothetical protein CCHOA_09820 [Corynebacterium choanae]|uniref:Uncharacterized protein n=1 Tax=Corynebacterium choanae TaxID=1862358 RepID=A0A3G6J8F6_9CORY|nr:hypothetical protein CCHOA_09820 [Corynebacterium choanae]
MKQRSQDVVVQTLKTPGRNPADAPAGHRFGSTGPPAYLVVEVSQNILTELIGLSVIRYQQRIV